MVEFEKIGTVYAEALLELTREGSAQQSTEEELRELVTILKSDDTIWKFIASPLLVASEKQKVLEKVLKGKVSDLVYKFLGVLAEKRRLNVLPEIYKSYVALLDEELGRRRVRMYTATEPGADLQKEVVSVLKGYLDADVILEPHVDPELLGGIVIRTGDLMIDTSIKSGLEAMRKKLLQRNIIGEEFYEN